MVKMCQAISEPCVFYRMTFLEKLKGPVLIHSLIPQLFFKHTEILDTRSCLVGIMCEVACT